MILSWAIAVAVTVKAFIMPDINDPKRCLPEEGQAFS